MIHNLWSSLWPNIFAPSVWTLTGIGVSHIALRLHHNRKIEELKRHLEPKPVITFNHKLTEKDVEEIKARFRKIQAKGYVVDGRVYHPSDVQILYPEKEQ